MKKLTLKQKAPPLLEQERRYQKHDRHRWRVTAMDIQHIKQTELTQSERDVLVNDGARWRKMGNGGHLDDWLAYAPGLDIRRRLAMKLSFTNKPEGKGYCAAFAALLKADGLDTMDKNSVSVVLWLNDEPERLSVLREVRDAMTPGQRSRLNSPQAARQRVLAVLKARNGGTEDKLKSSPLAVLKKSLVEREHKIAHLEERLAAAERYESRFDLQKSTIADIVRVMTDPTAISAHKATEIAKGILKAFKARQVPAG